MRSLFALVLILGAGLLFMAGYIVGKKRGECSLPTRPLESETTMPVETNTSVVKIEVPVSAKIPFKAPKPIEAVTDDTVGFAKRGQKQIIKLTDIQERVLQCEILDVAKGHLTVRRQSDLSTVQVPIAMLCPEDKAFAAYLFEERSGIASPEPTSNADIIWDELFKGM